MRDRCSIRTLLCLSLAAPVVSQGAARAALKPVVNASGQQRFVSTNGLSFTPAVLARVNDQTRASHFTGTAAVAHVEKAWDLVKKNPSDPRISREILPDGAKAYVVDLGAEVGVIGNKGPVPIPANHVRLVVGGDRYLISASPARGTTLTGDTWQRPTLASASHPATTRDDQQVAALLVGAGANPTVAARAADHVRLGVPSSAKYGTPADDLRVRNGYVLSMNADNHVLNWASWVTTSKSYDAAAPRSNDWRSDPTFRTKGTTPDDSDYAGAGLEYHRGHMVRSGERSSNLRENSKTFVYSNAVPQAKHNNIGPWNGLEEWVHARANAGDRIYNQAGPVFSGAKKTLGKDVAVPTSLFKVVTVLAPGETTITANTRVVAVMIPNNNEVPLTANWAGYRVSVAEIEQATGLRFFSNLPADVADALRNKRDTENIPYVMPPHVKEELERAQKRN